MSDKKTEVLIIRIDEESKKKAQDLAKRKKASISKIVRDALSKEAEVGPG